MIIKKTLKNEVVVNKLGTAQMKKQKMKFIICNYDY